jgi:hypothetical protein
MASLIVGKDKHGKLLQKIRKENVLEKKMT